MSGPIRPPLRITEQDGTPSVRPVNTIKVTNGTLTDDGDSTVSLVTGGGGGGGSGTVTSITFSAPLTGGTITTSGTVGINQASSTTDGYLSSTDWSTFNNKQDSITAGNLTEATSSILTITGGTGAVIGSGTTIAVQQASASADGYLSSTDWSTFNSKGSGTVTSVDVTGGTGLTSTGGPITTSGAITVNLDDTTVTPGSYTYSSITVDQQGRITAASSGTTPPIDGSGAAQQVTYWVDADTVTGSSNLTFDGTNLSVGGYVKSGTGVYDTEGTTDLTLQTNGGTNSGTIVIRDGAGQDIEITPNGGGVINLDGLKWPSADGSANQVLQTDGAGNLSFATSGGGGTTYGLDELYTTDQSYMQTSYDQYSITNMAPYAPSASTSYSATPPTKALFKPFIAPKTGNVTEMGIYINSLQGSAMSGYAAIYDTTDGMPKNLLGYATFDMNGSTGEIYQTTFSSTISLTAGRKYWYRWSDTMGSSSARTYRTVTNGINSSNPGHMTNYANQVDDSYIVCLQNFDTSGSTPPTAAATSNYTSNSGAGLPKVNVVIS